MSVFFFCDLVICGYELHVVVMGAPATSGKLPDCLFGNKSRYNMLRSDLGPQDTRDAG